MSKPTDLVQGTLDLLILKIVALEPMHGWAIAHRIRHMSSEVLQVGQSALYPALHKLEQQGFVEAEWKISETNRRAKYYSLTRAGRKAGGRKRRVGSASQRLSPLLSAPFEGGHAMPRWVTQLRLILTTLFRRNRVELELSEELQYHLEREIAERVGAGLTPEEARYAALR